MAGTNADMVYACCFLRTDILWERMKLLATVLRASMRYPGQSDVALSKWNRMLQANTAVCEVLHF